MRPPVPEGFAVRIARVKYHLVTSRDARGLSAKAECGAVVHSYNALSPDERLPHVPDCKRCWKNATPSGTKGAGGGR